MCEPRFDQLTQIVERSQEQINEARDKGRPIVRVTCPECGFDVQGIDVSDEYASDSGKSVEVIAHTGRTAEATWCPGSGGVIDPITPPSSQ
jgi:hypothetical protein